MKQTRPPASANPSIEQSLFEAFITAQRRPRYLALLSSPRGRKRILGRLAHCTDLDSSFARRVAETNPEAITGLLRKHGAAKKCYVMSESGALDAQELDLEIAVSLTVGQGMGTLISCIPGELAYYEGEEPGERYLLKRA